MQIVKEGILEISQAVVQLLLHPFFYLAVLLVLLQCWRQLELERRLFHVKLSSLWQEWLVSMFWGLLAGVLASSAIAYWGIDLQASLVYWIWGIAILLALFRLRFLSAVYAFAVVGLLQTGLAYLPQEVLQQSWYREWQPFLSPLAEADMAMLFAVLGLLLLAGALLIRWQGGRLARPLFIQGKRGKVIGAYQLRALWPVPLFLTVPAAGSSPGWTLLVLPVLLSFQEWTRTSWPWEKSISSFHRLAGFSAIVLALAVGLLLLPDRPYLIAVAALLILLGYEATLYLGRSEENKFAPKYVNDRRGLKVLGVIPGSPAAELGISVGEIIFRVNGRVVRAKQELHQALRTNPAYCKIELLTIEGEPRLLKRALYEGEHHQLGIIFVPDEHSRHTKRTDKESLLSLLRNSRSDRNRHNSDRSHSKREAEHPSERQQIET